jgi:hypothetical protein
MRRLSEVVVLVCIIFFGGSVVPTLGTAQETSPAASEKATTKGDDDCWHFLFYLPLWDVGFKADATVRGRSSEVLVSNQDTLEAFVHNLRGLGLGHFEVSKGRWGILAEGIYAKLVDSASKTKDIRIPIVPPVQIPLNSRFRVTAEQLFSEAAVWYDCYRSASRTGDQPVLTLEGLGGARYVYFRSKIGATITGPLGGTVHLSDQGKQDWADPFVGGRLFWNLSDHWLFGFRGDVGGFDLTSDFTGNLDTSIRYKFADCFNLYIGYRGLYMNHQDGSFKFDGWIYGPWVGVGVGF